MWELESECQSRSIVLDINKTWLPFNRFTYSRNASLIIYSVNLYLFSWKPRIPPVALKFIYMQNTIKKLERANSTFSNHLEKRKKFLEFSANNAIYRLRLERNVFIVTKIKSKNVVIVSVFRDSWRIISASTMVEGENRWLHEAWWSNQMALKKTTAPVATPEHWRPNWRNKLTSATQLFRKQQ